MVLKILIHTNHAIWLFLAERYNAISFQTVSQTSKTTRIGKNQTEEI